MIRWRAGTVTAVGRRWRGATEIDVAIVARTATDPVGVRALAYPLLVGEPEVGDRVLLNVTTLLMGLGTGGYAFVIALPDRLPPEPPADPKADPAADPTTEPTAEPTTEPTAEPTADPSAGADLRDGGHMVKARYTPLQPTLLGVDEQGSPHRDAMLAATDLGGLPVVIADLHSALPAIVAGIHATRPDTRIAYVMTDGGALPAWFSRSLDVLRARLAGTVTVGQAFGGDLEATNVHGGLLAARHVLRAEVAVIAPGPGNLGTGTAWGFSGTAAGEAVNATATLGGRPVGSLRISGADARRRHHGVSHHCLTAYGRVALAPADLVVPEGLPKPLADAVAAALAPLATRHRIVTVPVHGLDAALRASPVALSTMGRTLTEDPAYFLSAAAAGRHAAGMPTRDLGASPGSRPR